MAWQDGGSWAGRCRHAATPIAGPLDLAYKSHVCPPTLRARGEYRGQHVTAGAERVGARGHAAGRLAAVGAAHGALAGTDSARRPRRRWTAAPHRRYHAERG